MSLGSEWEKRLNVGKPQVYELNEEERASAEKQRAEKIILKLQEGLNKVTGHQCPVMQLDYRETTQRFDGMYGKKFTSPDKFRGVARIVVEYCLSNGLDVYVWEEDFSMHLREKFGAEIWVTPHGVPY